MAQDFNIYPYYDDFDASKNFHRVLFKPGAAVQARELTQLQTILQDQITKFGNHIFKHGSVVIPGNSFAELGVDSVTGATSDLSAFDQTAVVGQTSGVTAFVKKTSGNQLYVAYIQPGTAGEKTFAVGEVINVIGTPSTSTTATALGIGSLAYVNEGVYYVNGAFVTVLKQTAVMSNDAVPSAQVFLKITESVVSSDEDTTLLDPAQGSYNYAAPGSDRQKITLTLVALPLGQTLGEDYVELMRYNVGVLEQHNRFAKYSELERNLARRTYDESGDYLVNGYSIKLVENLRTRFNNGFDVAGSRDAFTVKSTPGKAYIKGFEVETLAPASLTIPKARTAAHIKTGKTTAQLDYGSYILVTDLKGLPNFTQREQVGLWNDADPANASATQMGTIRAFGIDYFLGDPNSQSAIYKLYGFDVSNIDVADVGGIRFGAGGSATVLQTFTVNNIVGTIAPADIFTDQSATRAATVHYKFDSTLYVYKHDHTKQIPIVGDVIISGTKSANLTQSLHITTSKELPLVQLPELVVKSTKTQENTIDTSYTVWKTFVITTDGSGNGAYTLPFGVFNQPEPGSTVAVFSGGVVGFTKLSTSSPSTFNIISGPINTTVTVATQVLKQNAAPKTKTLTTQTLNNVVPVSSISLQKADVYRVVSITSAGVDVTDRYTLDNGQRDFYYGVAYLNLNGILPTSDITVVFEYFSHSGGGDYFGPDSYADIEKIPTYRSTNTSAVYGLANYLDFRPRVSDAGSFSSIFSETVTNGAFLSTSYQYYVHRMDVLYINRAGAVGVAQGIPGGKKPDVPADTIDIADLLVPAYTFNVSDILVRMSKKFRYTMSDIQRLESRVGNVEYFSTLNAVENTLLSYDLIDAATGLPRFKNGYLVDNFDNPFTIADKYNHNFRCSNSRKNLTADMSTAEVIPELTAASTNYRLTGTLVSLPYTDVPLVSQLTSTRVTNLNPFMVFSWEGALTIEPPSDSWSEIEQLGTIRNSRTETVVIRREVRVEIPAPPPPPPPPVPIIEIPQIIFPPAPAPAPPPPPPPIWDWLNQTVIVPIPPLPIPPEPVPVVPEPTQTITAWARDLGLVDGANRFSPRWDDLIMFDVPASVGNELNRNIVAQNTAAMQAGTWMTPVWAEGISALNAAFTEFGGAQVNTGDQFASSAVGGRHSPETVIDFWERRTAGEFN